MELTHYFFVLQMQRLVVCGSLPCSKDEAAVLAGMQLRLEECWPRSRPPRIHTGAPTPSPAAPTTPNVNLDKAAARGPEDDKVWLNNAGYSF